MRRTNLLLLRIKNGLTQSEFSEKIGCHRQTYSAIENGEREGSAKFWNGLIAAFPMSDEELKGVMKTDNE